MTYSTATGTAIIQAMNVQRTVLSLHVKILGSPHHVARQENTSVKVAVSNFKFATLSSFEQIGQTADNEQYCSDTRKRRSDRSGLAHC